MKVYKFGGASVKDAPGIRHLARIVSVESDNLVVVISAFGKTTNALEKVLKAWLTDDRFRDANILWSESTNRIRGIFDFKKKRIYVTQGFIGGTVAGQTTTLGREGGGKKII